MARPSHCPLELRRRAVRMVAEVRPEYDTEWAAMKAVASKLGIGTTETLRKWVRQDQVDVGARPGTTTEESTQIKAMKKEIAELKRANEILKAAASFFADKRRKSSAARTIRDAELKTLIQDAYKANYRVYGARKIWRHLNRQGQPVARCTVERLMRGLGITGAIRGKKVITTIPDRPHHALRTCRP